MSQLSARNITIEYKSGNSVIYPIRDLDLNVSSGELVFVIGVNGSGKSTLLRTLAGIQSPSKGEIFWSGQQLNEIQLADRPTKTAYMFSQYNRVEGMKVMDLVLLGRHPYTSRFGKFSESDLEVSSKALQRVGLIDYDHRNISTLSDGEFKKALLAKLLAQECPIMILDEPTTHLDLPSELSFIKLLKKESQEEGRAVILSTHNLQAALKLADRILILGKDGAYSIGNSTEISSSELMCQLLNSNELAIENGNLIYKLNEK